jgi:glycolate oxidase FAD binding subunit
MGSDLDPAMTDMTDQLVQAVKTAAATGGQLQIVGGGTKRWYGRESRGRELSLAEHRGIVDYVPTELVLTARAGTPLVEIEQGLAEQGQMLPFEPPHFGPEATLGGTLACALSGPRRPFAGAARDAVLGVRILNGTGETLRFGGQVMKNVAGYDVSRLMVGALGSLGIILDASVKVLPAPATEMTRVLEATPEQAIAMMNEWAGRPLPLSAAAYMDRHLYVRLSGAQAGVSAAAARVGGELLPDDRLFWLELKEQRLPFFAGDSPPLWRLSVPPATPPLVVPGEQLIDWGGAQRWLRTDADAGVIHSQARAAGGHASLFRHGDRTREVFAPLDSVLARVHRNLKQAFDPEGVLNPGRMYRDL